MALGIHSIEAYQNHVNYGRGVCCFEACLSRCVVQARFIVMPDDWEDLHVTRETTYMGTMDEAHNRRFAPHNSDALLLDDRYV